MDSGRDSYRFEGFEEPHYTPIPDVFFDQVMCHLSEAELRVALYIMRRTFGFKKHADAISFSQFLKGITTRDGRRLDHGCGISGRTNLTRALKGLEEKGLIVARRSVSAKGDAQTTVYELRFKENQVVPQRDHHQSTVVPQDDHPLPLPVIEDDHPGDRATPPVVTKRDAQETVPQDSDLQSTADHETVLSMIEERTTLDAAIDAASTQFGDTRHAAANRSRAARLLDGIAESYRDRIAEVARTRVTDVLRGGGIANPMAYYFGVLEDLARQARSATGGSTSLAGRYSHLVQR